MFGTGGDTEDLWAGEVDSASDLSDLFVDDEPRQTNKRGTKAKKDRRKGGGKVGGRARVVRNHCNGLMCQGAEVTLTLLTVVTTVLQPASVGKAECKQLPPEPQEGNTECVYPASVHCPPTPKEAKAIHLGLLFTKAIVFLTSHSEHAGTSSSSATSRRSGSSSW